MGLGIRVDNHSEGAVGCGNVAPEDSCGRRAAG